MWIVSALGHHASQPQAWSRAVREEDVEDVKTYCLSQIKDADLLPAVGHNHLGGPLAVPSIHVTPCCAFSHTHTHHSYSTLGKGGLHQIDGQLFVHRISLKKFFGTDYPRPSSISTVVLYN